MKLSEEQKYIIKEVLKFHKKITTVGGWAGCGKSTVIRHLADLLPNFAVCAYTGKAANVLRKKGIAAKTIHSLIYKAIEGEDGKVYFALSNYIDCEGIIVDEASMVSKEIYQHLLSFNKPVVFVGDHGQLEPVGDDFNLMENPDYKLEKIHRNAGEIAYFAEHVRKGFRPSSWEIKNGNSEKIKFLSKFSYKEFVLEVDQIICAFNKLRSETNILVRKKLNRKEYPEENDRVICLRNNSLLGLFNGMQGVIKNVFKKNSFIFESNDQQFQIFYDPNVFNQVKYEFDHNRDAPDPFDYAYAITCHKSQGDEFNKVLVLEQKCDLWDQKRWSYTAASRAKQKLLWCDF